MSLSKFLKKSNTKTRVCCMVLLLLLFVIIRNSTRRPLSIIEKYTNRSTKKAKYHTTISTIYDTFYVNIYDNLLFSDNKIRYECKELIKIVNINKNTIVLDIGCALGHHCKVFKDQKAKSTGLDKSSAMIKKARSNYPTCLFVKGNMLNQKLFDRERFNLLTCFYFTVYYTRQKDLFFKNCYYWLKPGGYLAIHLVNRDKFNPIIPAGDPLVIVSPQKHAKERIVTSLVQFNGYKYKSKFITHSTDKERVVFKETFKFKDNTYRINEHKLYMEETKDILEIALNNGFTILSKIDLMICGYDYQYIFVLQK